MNRRAFLKRFGQALAVATVAPVAIPKLLDRPDTWVPKLRPDQLALWDKTPFYVQTRRVTHYCSEEYLKAINAIAFARAQSGLSKAWETFSKRESLVT